MTDRLIGFGQRVDYFIVFFVIETSNLEPVSFIKDG